MPEPVAEEEEAEGEYESHLPQVVKGKRRRAKAAAERLAQQTQVRQVGKLHVVDSHGS